MNKNNSSSVHNFTEPKLKKQGTNLVRLPPINLNEIEGSDRKSTDKIISRKHAHNFNNNNEGTRE